MLIHRRLKQEFDPHGVFNTILGWVHLGPYPWLQSERMAMPALVLESTWANAGATVILGESDQLGATATSLGLTGTERDLLPALPRGTGLWKVSGRSHVVRHRLHVDELAVFDTDAAMRDRPASRSAS